MERSTSTSASKSSLSSRLIFPAPPIRSALFSRAARKLAVSLLAPRRESANTEAPLAAAVLNASEDESKQSDSSSDSDLVPDEPNLKLGEDERKPSMAGRAARFFRKKN